jgi:Tfp pilus assembly protein PilN
VREGSKDIITLGVTIMSFLLIFCLFLTAKVYLKNLRKTAIEEMEESTTAEARSLEGASTKVRVLRGLLETRGKGLYVFDKLTSMITDDIYLTAFSYDRDGAVTIGGTAESMSRVYAFVTTLEESLYFKNVETKQTKTRKEGGKEVADFEISCTYADITA